MPNFKEGDLVRFISREALLESDEEMGAAYYYVDGSIAYFHDLPISTLYKVCYYGGVSEHSVYCRLIPYHCKVYKKTKGNTVLKDSLTPVNDKPIL